MKQKSAYSQKLLDPRWQKKRLEILSRDEFHCKKCYTDSSTLHVHHRRYFQGKDPWDIENEFLITLCESCHEGETEFLAESTHDLVQVVKSKFFSTDIHEITQGFINVGTYYDSNVTASIIQYWLTNRLKEMGDEYFKHLKGDKPDAIDGDDDF
jgi:hypothetical protein